MNAFVRNPQSRLPIYVKKPNFTVSDTKDLSAYDLVAMETLEEEYGFHIGKRDCGFRTKALKSSTPAGNPKSKEYTQGTSVVDSPSLAGAIT